MDEAIAGVRDVMKIQDFLEIKPAIELSFLAAKNSVPKSKSGPDKLDKQEFRLFLVALTQRLEYLQAFNKLDAGGNGSIDQQEFVNSKQLIEKWVGPIDPAAEFAKIDKSGTGQIDFDEFCMWSMAKNLEVEGF